MGVKPPRFGRPIITKGERLGGIILRFDFSDEFPEDNGPVFEMWDDEALLMARIILDELEGSDVPN